MDSKNVFIIESKPYKKQSSMTGIAEENRSTSA